jgi:hypothetical protein
MNDNDPFGPAEQRLHTFIEDRYPDRAAAQRTIVRQSIHQRTQREHVRFILRLYASIMKWMKPLVLAILFFASASYFLRLSSQGLSAIVPAGDEALAVFLFVILYTFEQVFGRLVRHGQFWNFKDGWHLELSPAFKRMYRASHHFVQAQRREGTR